MHVGRLQHWTGSIVGDGYALLPTSAATLDPLHSTGLAHTLSGVSRLAKVLLGKEEKQMERLHMYAAQVQCEIRLLDRLLSTAYIAMDSMESFTAASMLYFAVAIRHEELREQRRENSEEAVWGADQRTVREAVAQGCECIQRSCKMGNRAGDRQGKRLKELVPILESLCAVPLYTADSKGLYGYTFADK